RGAFDGANMAATPTPVPAAPRPQPTPLPKPAPELAQQARAASPIDLLADAVQQRGTWQQSPVFQNIVPMAAAIFIHLVIIVVGYFLYRGIQHVVNVTREQLIVPDATIVENAPVGGIPNPGLGEDPSRAAAQDQIQVASNTEGWSSKASQTITQS